MASPILQGVDFNAKINLKVQSHVLTWREKAANYQRKSCGPKYHRQEGNYLIRGCFHFPCLL